MATIICKMCGAEFKSAANAKFCAACKTQRARDCSRKQYLKKRHKSDAEEERKKAMNDEVVQSELSRPEKSGKPSIIKWLVEQANETLRDAEGSDLSDCALIGKAIGLLTAAEALMEGEL